MNYDDPLVKKEAKKHKKFLESFTINPGSFQINNNQYFFVNFYRWKKMTDCAVVSPTSKAGEREFLDAFDALLEYAELTTLILTHVGEKSSANMHAFTMMEDFLSDVLNKNGTHLTQEDKNVFTYCLERTKIIIDLQERMRKIHEDFYKKTKNFHDGITENFTKQDIKEAANYLGEFDYIQYRQLVANYESIPKFKYIKESKNPDVKRHISDTVKRYLEEFSINENRQIKRIESIKFQSNMAALTKEEHIEGAKKDFYKNLAETNASSRKELRYLM